MFLTPLKPPTKTSISIDAVQSSLYFLHVERPEDEELRKSIEATKATESRNKENLPIQRKPLPQAPYANYPPSPRPHSPPKSYPHYQPPLPGSQTATQAERQAARGMHLRLTTSEATTRPTIQRKPVGTRPMPMRPISEPLSATTDWESGDSPSPVAGGQRTSRLPRKPVQSAASANAYQFNRANSDGTYSEVSTSQLSQRPSVLAGESTETTKDVTSGTLHITLIRRDPASGSQWNVGSITYREPVAPDTPLKDFEIELTAPGYVKFAQLEGSPGNGLHRKVAYMLVPSSEASPATRQRSNSAELFSTGNSSSSKKPRQAYSFTSPWQGVCAFSNGVDGKSIRCRHILPSGNPATAAAAADVAELRFNLPWSILRLKDPNRKDKEASEASPLHSATASNKQQWRRSFQALTHKARVQISHLESSNEASHVVRSRKGSVGASRSSEEDRMDLTLGRERAGGGFMGQSAKLGKLIVNDEGLKMCDLAVAASMGVWWQHYAGDMAY